MDNLQKLKGSNVVVYDLEIKKTIEECTNGWNSLDEMGISVGCAYDYRSGRFRVFMDDNILELVERLNEPETVVVAFNHVHFDNQLLRASGFKLRPDLELNNYDLMRVSKDGAGIGADDRRHKGFRLDDHLKALGLPMKTANGALAPIMWKEGKIGTLVDYCLNDVTQEKALFEYFCEHGRSACQFQSTPYRIKRLKRFEE